MNHFSILILIIGFICCVNGRIYFPKTSLKLSNSSYKYETKYYETKVDHFSFTTTRKFKMKYLINTDYWKTDGPILFYCGNEAPIEVYAKNTGFMWELAPQLKAAVIFAEHRYYGSSMPFGADSFKSPEKFGYLMAEQALADYATFLSDFKKNNTNFSVDPPVIAFGGSYGGMLAAWFRQKYPNIVAGSIAASAPVWLLPGLTDCNRYDQITTQSFATTGSANCVNNIRHGWDAIQRIGEKGETGRQFLSKTFQTCDKVDSVSDFIAFLMDYIRGFTMVNYPYETNFLGALPAWPVKYFCKFLNYNIDAKDDNILAKALADAFLSLLTYSPDFKCFDWKGSNSGDIDANGWFLQTCMEMMTPMCSNGVTDMFQPLAWNETEYKELCFKTFGVRPSDTWAKTSFWAKKLATVSNVVYSNGGLDPWSGLGILRNSAVPKSKCLFNPKGAHHLDLRGSNPSDDVTLKRIRSMEKMYIKLFIDEWYSDYRLRQ